MRTAAMGAGVALTLVALFMATLTLRETWTQINLSGFVRTEFVVTGYREKTGDSDAVMSGRVVSSGERFERMRESFVGVDVVRKWKKEGRLKGYRATVWYLNLKTAVHPRQPQPAPMCTPPRAILRNHPLGEARNSCAAQ